MKISFVLVLAAMSSFAQAPSPDLRDAFQKQLRDRLLHQVVTLKDCYSSNDLKFDETGNLVSKSSTGPWTLFAKLEVNSLDLKQDALKLKARRLVATFPSQNQVQYVRTNVDANIEVRLTKSASEFAELQNAIQQIFLSGKDDFADYVPAYWQSEVRSLERSPLPFNPDAALPHPSVSTTSSTTSAVSPPHVDYSRDPAYTELARSQRVQGIVILWLVVGTDGHVRDVRITRPLGFGLDEEAVKAIQSWRFSPAKRNGQPVAVQMNVEVNFHLYN